MVAVRNGQTCERVDIVGRCELCALERGPRLLVHNGDVVACIIAQQTERGSDRANADGGGADNGNGHLRGGAHGAAGNDLVDQFFGGFLRDLIGQFVVDVVQESGTAHIHNFVGQADPLLDALRNEVDHAENEGFLADACCALGVNDRAGCADLEADLEVALDIGFLHAASDLVTFPRGTDDVVDEFGYGHLAAGYVLGQQSTALLVVIGLDVVCVCVDVRIGVADFDVFHLSYLCFGFGDNGCDEAFRDLCGSLASFCLVCLAAFDFGFDSLFFGLISVQFFEGSFLGRFGLDLREASFEGVHFHIGKVHSLPPIG